MPAKLQKINDICNTLQHFLQFFCPNACIYANLFVSLHRKTFDFRLSTFDYQHNMKLTLLVVGKTVGTELPKMIDTYVQRLKHYIPFDIQVIPDLKNTKSLSESQQKQQEGEAILRAVEGCYVVLLDEHGKEYRSLTFASQLQSWLNTSTRGLTFVIGGPYGFSEAVYQRADAKISLSQMTFSHQMIRLLFVEQLYRAMTILRGEPYHHE